MRKVLIYSLVVSKMEDLESYLIFELQLSEEASLKRSNRMRMFVSSLSKAAVYPLCRFRKWKKLKYRCAVFERDWVFAYELFDEGIIVRDMSHTSLLKE